VAQEKKYIRLINRLNDISFNLDTSEDIILSVNEIAFLDKLLNVVQDFINGKLE